MENFAKIFVRVLKICLYSVLFFTLLFCLEIFGGEIFPQLINYFNVFYQSPYLAEILYTLPLGALGLLVFMLIIAPFFALKEKITGNISKPEFLMLCGISLAAIIGTALVVFIFIFPQRIGFPCEILSLEDSGRLYNFNYLMESINWPDVTGIYSMIIFVISAMGIPFAFKFRNKFSKFISSSLWALLIISFIFIIIFGLPGRSRRSPDSRRAADLGQMRLALELYFDTQRHYPIADSWESLRQELTGSNCDNISCISSVPDDYCSKTAPLHQYAYRASSDGSTYVLKAILGAKNNTLLANDLDGEILGLWCGKPGKEIEYCVSN